MGFFSNILNKVKVTVKKVGSTAIKKAKVVTRYVRPTKVLSTVRNVVSKITRKTKTYVSKAAGTAKYISSAAVKNTTRRLLSTIRKLKPKFALPKVKQQVITQASQQAMAQGKVDSGGLMDYIERLNEEYDPGTLAATAAVDDLSGTEADDVISESILDIIGAGGKKLTSKQNLKYIVIAVIVLIPIVLIVWRRAKRKKKETRK